MAEKTIEISGLKITGYEDDYILQTIERTQKFYEQQILQEWTPLLGDPKLILDVGANLGNHTLYWATHLSVEKIYSFEPFPANYKCLKKNIEDNHLPFIYTLPLAIGDKNGEVKVKSFDSGNYGATTLEYSEDKEETNVMSAVTLDNLKEKLNLSKVDFVKIDTEGFEVHVLDGMKCILEESCPVIWIEVGEKTVADVVHRLQKLGYQLAKMSGANLLFLPEKMKQKAQVTLSDVLVEDMHYLERTNAYYKNYTTAKQWLDSKQKQLDQVTQENNDLQNETQEQVDKLARLQELLMNCYYELEEDVKVLNIAKRQMLQLNAKLQILNAKNREYEAKLSKIYNTWYGRVALKIYKGLRKIKRFFRK